MPDGESASGICGEEQHLHRFCNDVNVGRTPDRVEAQQWNPTQAYLVEDLILTFEQRQALGSRPWPVIVPSIRNVNLEQLASAR